ncbi:MAG: ankyrin repeat domain-containing protein [Betaproteobacteria bacterium]
MLLLLPAGQSLAHPDPATYGHSLEAGDIAQLRAWLDAGLPPDFLADRIGTGLMIAAWRGDIPMMSLLVARGADVNKANAIGERALLHAAWRGHSNAVRWLLARGAKINSDPMQWSALHYAVFAGQAQVAQLLLDNGADINARSTNGSSVLMMAVYEGHEPLVRQLLARGADRSVKNDRGDGALEWAFKYQRLGIARLVAAAPEFAAAANQPKARWGSALRSLSEGEPIAALPASAPPAPPDETAGQIQDLLHLRNILASRGLTAATEKMDRRIAALRAQRARADPNRPPVVMLEISASRTRPGDQKARLIYGADGPAP